MYSQFMMHGQKNIKILICTNVDGYISFHD